MYINCKTFFSFRYGIYSMEEPVKGAVEKSIQAIALTNINNTCDSWDFVQYCGEHGIKPVGGTEIRNGNKLMYLLLARDNMGIATIWVGHCKH